MLKILILKILCQSHCQSDSDIIFLELGLSASKAQGFQNKDSLKAL